VAVVLTTVVDLNGVGLLTARLDFVRELPIHFAEDRKPMCDVFASAPVGDGNIPRVRNEIVRSEFGIVRALKSNKVARPLAA